MTTQRDMEKVRKQLIEHLEDLLEKIKNSEPTPDQEQDIDFLIYVDDEIQACLNNWYY